MMYYVLPNLYNDIHFIYAMQGMKSGKAIPNS